MNRGPCGPVAFRRFDYHKGRKRLTRPKEEKTDIDSGDIRFAQEIENDHLEPWHKLAQRVMHEIEEGQEKHEDTRFGNCAQAAVPKVGRTLSQKG